MIEIKEWSQAVSSELKELGDAGYQRKVWLNKNGEEQSSFTEVICALYDEHDFEGYIKRVKDECSDQDLINSIESVNYALDDFLKKIEDNPPIEAILNSVEWKQIQVLAKEAYEQMIKNINLQ